MKLLVCFVILSVITGFSFPLFKTQNFGWPRPEPVWEFELEGVPLQAADDSVEGRTRSEEELEDERQQEENVSRAVDSTFDVDEGAENFYGDELGTDRITEDTVEDTEDEVDLEDDVESNDVDGSEDDMFDYDKPNDPEQENIDSLNEEASYSSREITQVETDDMFQNDDTSDKDIEDAADDDGISISEMKNEDERKEDDKKDDDGHTDNDDSHDDDGSGKVRDSQSDDGNTDIIDIEEGSGETDVDLEM